jgi:hypothetical protein
VPGDAGAGVINRVGIALRLPTVRMPDPNATPDCLFLDYLTMPVVTAVFGQATGGRCDLPNSRRRLAVTNRPSTP